MMVKGGRDGTCSQRDANCAGGAAERCWLAVSQGRASTLLASGGSARSPQLHEANEHRFTFLTFRYLATGMHARAVTLSPRTNLHLQAETLKRLAVTKLNGSASAVSTLTMNHFFPRPLMHEPSRSWLLGRSGSALPSPLSSIHSLLITLNSGPSDRSRTVKDYARIQHTAPLSSGPAHRSSFRRVKEALDVYAVLSAFAFFGSSGRSKAGILPQLISSDRRFRLGSITEERAAQHERCIARSCTSLRLLRFSDFSV